MLTKDIMLKSTGAKLELMHDLEMIQLVRRNIRGGFSYVNTRRFDTEEMEKAVAATLPAGEGEPNFSIAYVDANNLYGHAMRMPMPVEDFAWMSDEQLSLYDPIRDAREDSPEGYILEVTLDYPENLHLAHNSFPLAPEHAKIEGHWLSPYAMNALQKLTKKTSYSANKLTATFNRRERYVCHALNLRFYLEQGLKLVQIHRGVSFTQKTVFRPYIDACTQKRAASKTKAAKDMYKLLCNSLFGKMIENGTNRMDCRFVTSRDAALMRNTDPRLQGHMIFHENLSMAFLRKKTVQLNQNWAIGFTVLELSKLHMQRLYYERIRPAFDNRVMVLLSDTDSWVLALPCKSADDAVRRLRDIMDTSNYPQGHVLASNRVKNLTGYLKNETAGDEIREVVAVRSKTYAIRTEGATEKKCKGVKRNVVKNDITMEDYRKCVRQDGVVDQHEVVQHSIQSRSHVNRTMRQRKLAFSSFDDKRYLLCAIHSVPYGSKFIEWQRMNGGRCPMCRKPKLLW